MSQPQVKQTPDELIALARAEHKPVATCCLFSGGNDSTVLAHRCREHYDGLAWIDTGTAVPGVETFVREYAEWIEQPPDAEQAVVGDSRLRGR
ncbi:MAG TPA: hypothetical protein VMB51_16100 [Solirubrobacteraceae bacterium]|nr:hypothetical protein [Solirubrobacteraceae bacterium]